VLNGLPRNWLGEPVIQASAKLSAHSTAKYSAAQRDTKYAAFRPTASPEDGQWFLSLADSNPERDLAVTTVITYALDSLRDFARRRYTGQPGKVYCISKATVEVAIYAPICQAENLKHRMYARAHQDQGGRRSRRHRPPDGPLSHSGGVSSARQRGRKNVRKVDLPVRPQDANVPSSSPLAYLPIVPRGYQRGA
jgi:hypothetical protein